jgi:hypothetical protein
MHEKAMVDSRGPMKRLYATTDPTEAELIRVLLREKGIESDLDNEGGAAYAIGFPTAAVPLGINVRDEDAADAVELLARHFEKNDKKAAELEPGQPSDVERKIRQQRPRKRLLWALIFLLPNALAPLYFSLRGDLGLGAIGVLLLLGAIGIAWGIHALAGLGVKKRGPAP